MFKCSLMAALLVTCGWGDSISVEDNKTTATPTMHDKQVENMNAYEKALHSFGTLTQDVKAVYTNLTQDKDEK